MRPAAKAVLEHEFAWRAKEPFTPGPRSLNFHLREIMPTQAAAGLRFIRKALGTVQSTKSVSTAGSESSPRTPGPVAPPRSPIPSYAMPESNEAASKAFATEPNNEMLQQEVDRLQADLARARDGVMAIQKEDRNVKVLRAAAMKQLENDMQDWPSSRQEEEAIRERKLRQVLHDERMESDEKYRLRFEYKEKMKSAILQNSATAMSSEIARLHRLVEDRRREREEEDRCVKTMMARLKNTIDETVTEMQNPSAGGSRRHTNAGNRIDEPQTDVQRYHLQTPPLSAARDQERRTALDQSSPASRNTERRGVSKRFVSDNLSFEVGGEDDVCPSPGGQSAGKSREFEASWEKPSKYSTPCAYLRYDAKDEEGRTCYIGQLVNGWRHGLGVLKYADRSKYAGAWENDHPSGYGVERYADGSVYTGGFRKDLRHGYGVFEVSPDVSYCGQFEDGEIHGALYIRELRPAGEIQETAARAEHGQVFREPDWDGLSDEDPRKAIAASMRHLMDVLRSKVSEATSRARNMSQDAHDLALEVANDAGLLSEIGSPSTCDDRYFCSAHSHLRNLPAPAILSAPSGGREPPPPAGNLDNSATDREAADLSAGIAIEAMAKLPDLEALFSKFATVIEAKDKKRPRKAAMEVQQFMRVLEHLKLLPEKVSQNAVRDLFTQACATSKTSAASSRSSAKSSKPTRGNISRMDEAGFKWAMMKLLANFHGGEKTVLPVVSGAISESSGDNAQKRPGQSRTSATAGRFTCVAQNSMQMWSSPPPPSTLSYRLLVIVNPGANS